MPASEPNVAAQRRWSVEEVRAMQDESNPAPRYELVDGELLVTPSPSPTHQRAVLILARLLDDHVQAHELGTVFMSPADLELETGTVLQPDVFVVPTGAGPLTSWRAVGSILLAIEVLSPSTARTDRGRKRRFYQRVGVPEYWIADTDARLVERWRPDDERPELLDERIDWNTAGASGPLVIDLAMLFARSHGEQRRS